MPRPRKFEEAEVIASAGRVFAESGYAGTSVDDLVAATGLGRQSLYNAFGGKKELFMRAFLSDTEDAVAAVEAVRHGTDSPIGRIRAQLVKVAVTYGSAQAQPPLFVKAAMELSARDAEVQASALKAFDDMSAHYAACVADAQGAGEVDATADADALGAFFLALIEGMAALGGAGVSRASLTTIGLTSLAAIPLTDRGRDALETSAGDWS
ncbi:TetR/AcrR family transcriptional regulator [Promicromonospora thailandica]|uniref:Transcriptional regulator, TetR family n=1 Tax=Promicromonospora thailandica TaxID=765201 RepID=A0A9X2G7I8_9MICO|nr:TetR/AcrR family transcriptional regulator [Promicromonospora thailandica]MCP2267065.1 transcriptional regulator, TetR family [Promicromonospora thailandica]BFF16658.1 TetR/AcrR family transcriptional regulator [Promicromonospora thailandica]